MASEGSLEAHLVRAGLDLVQPFNVDFYNEAVQPEHRLPAPRVGALGVLIGNTRALWPAFLKALADQPQLKASSDPLDRYVEQTITALPDRFEARFAHVLEPALPFQRMGQLAGLAYLAPAQLLVHPRYGPWIALRAALVFDRPGPQTPTQVQDPCGQCKQACEPVMARAMAKTRTLSQAAIREVWRDWLAVRDACPVGREHRYSEAQIRYHYLKDRSVLEPSTR